MKPNTISTKIKLIEIFFIILMTSIIITTIYLNEKNKKDAQAVIDNPNFRDILDAIYKN